MGASRKKLMHRSVPVVSKVCARKEEERLRAIHRGKLKEIRSSLDTRQPEVLKLDHVRSNLKREQLLEDRYTEIDRCNRILLQKMSDIMRHRSSTGSMIANHSLPHLPVSLNKQARRKELLRINRENEHILHRIQRTQPMYSHVKWEQNHRANQGYLRNCCEYPVVLTKEVEDDNPLESSSLAMKSSTSSTGVFPNILQQNSVPVVSASSVLDQTRFVHKEGKKFGSTYYLIELSTDGRALTVSAYDADTQQTLELVVNEKNHRKYFRECGGDYALLAKRLKIEDERLIILPQGVEGSEKMEEGMMLMAKAKQPVSSMYSGVAGGYN